MTRAVPGADTAPDSVFDAPGFRATYAVGVVWSLCRWAIGFLGAYVVTEATGSPRLVQLTGALLWAPLLLAGPIGGAVSDRLPRRALLLGQFVVLGPLTALVGGLALADRLPLWALYAYMVMAGFGWVIDMTVRRALVYDLVGDPLVDRAMAFEGLASALGLAIGALAGGALIAGFGAGGAYLAVACAIGVAALLLTAVPASAPTDVEGSPPPDGHEGRADGDTAATGRSKRSFLGEVADGIRLIGRWPVVASILGVTALTNFFHFAYFPIVPVIAERVTDSPVATGALASATGLGMAVGALVILLAPVPRGPAYAVGSGGAFVFLIGFAVFDRYWLVFVSLFLASCFVGLFGATQSALVMTAVDEAMRGRAMGLLSMAIGMLPIGMTVLGEVAERFGAPTGLVLANVIGFVCLATFLRLRPAVLGVR